MKSLKSRLATRALSFGKKIRSRNFALNEFFRKDGGFKDFDSVDDNVYLSTFGKNLQRGLVWESEQKEEFIISLLLNKPVPALAIYSPNVKGGEKVAYIIDGKQRLNAVKEFLDSEFGVDIDGEVIIFDELSKADQDFIMGLELPTMIYESVAELTDDNLIEWFLHVNFKGSSQNYNHMYDLEQLLKS